MKITSCFKRDGYGWCRGWTIGTESLVMTHGWGFEQRHLVRGPSAIGRAYAVPQCPNTRCR